MAHLIDISGKVDLPEQTSRFVTPNSKEFIGLKNKIFQKKKNKSDLNRKNKVQEVLVKKASHTCGINPMGKIYEGENSQRGISNATISNRRTKQSCQICECPIQTDSNDDDDYKSNGWFTEFFNVLILSGFMIYMMMLMHSEFILSKKVEKILIDKEMRAMEGIIEQVSGQIIQIVIWGNFCFQRMINRL